MMHVMYCKAECCKMITHKLPGYFGAELDMRQNKEVSIICEGILPMELMGKKAEEAIIDA